MFEKQSITVENTKLLFLPTSKTKKTLCNSFVFDPEKDKKNLGKLLLLIKIDRDTRENREISRGIVEVVKSEFYSDPKRGAEESLENSLVKVNEILKELASLGKINWINKLHVVIACLYDRNLVVTQTGKVSSILIREGTASFINSDADDKKPSQPQKTFVGLTSGKLKSQDYLVLATESLLEFFSIEKLIQILGQKKIKEAKDYIQKLISEQIGNEETVATILLAFDPRRKKEEKLSPAFAKVENLEKFPEEILEASETQDTIKTPEREREKEAIARRLRAKKSKKFPYNIIYSSKGSLLLFLRKGKKTTKYTFEHSWPLFKKTSITFYFAAQKTASQTKNLFQKAYKKIHKAKSKTPKPVEINPRKSSLFRGVQDKIKPRKQNILVSRLAVVPAIPIAAIKRFQSLPKRYKIISTSLPIVILVLALGFIFIERNKAEDTDVASDDQEILKQAEDKRKQALDAMIYQDEDQARNALEEAKGLLSQVLGSQTHREQAQKLNSEIQDQFDTINRITTISEPLLLTDIGKINSNLTPLELIGLGNQIYALCSENNTILRFDLESEETVQLSPNFANIGNLHLASPIDEERNIVFVNENNEFALFNIKDFEIKKIEAPSPFDPNQIQDLAYYGKKIYTLNPEQNQIVKYERTISGLSKGAEWLREGEIGNAISLSIDSNIYVLKSDGNIMKFRAGKPTEFKKPDLNPPLVSPNKIFTKSEYKYLYILDPPNKRVVVLDKEKGKLVNQFVSAKFVDLKDIWVNPEETLIYILADKSIWQIENKGE